MPFIKPVFPAPEELVEDFAGIVGRNWFTNSGPLEQLLEERMASYLGGTVHVALTSSGTSGLLLAIRALAREDREEILVPSFTFAAGPEAILWCGFRPVFMDISLDTWQPDVEPAESYLRKNQQKIAAVLLCNSFGVGQPQIAEWEQAAVRYGLPLIVDSAAGFGSRYPSNEYVGTRGDAEVFSLHATKPFAVGEGGAVSSRSDQLIEKIRSLRNFGFSEEGRATSLGLNAKLPEMAAAVGLRQLKIFEKRLQRRREILQQLQDSLHQLGVRFQPGALESSVPFASAVLPRVVNREDLQAQFRKQGVETRAYYNPPLHYHDLFVSCPRTGTLDATEAICRYIISLPVIEGLSRTSYDRLSRVIEEAVPRA